MDEYLLALGGLVILFFAGDLLVRGAVNLSLRIGVPALIVSLTVVAFGTSAPELLISISAVLEDAPGIAIGNVVGSNTANVLLVLGIPAMISGLATSRFAAQKTYLIMCAALAVFAVVVHFGPLTWVHGLILLAFMAGFLGDAFRDARSRRRDAKHEVEGVDHSLSRRKITFFLLAGMIGLPIGADMLVIGAVEIAEEFGLREAAIGLTLVALGTSLPELATSISAALRRNADIAIGNVIGSTIFNLLAITGVATLFGQIPVDPEILSLDLWVMIGASLVLAPFVLLRRDIGRLVGGAFAVLYAVYVFVILI